MNKTIRCPVVGSGGGAEAPKLSFIQPETCEGTTKSDRQPVRAYTSTEKTLPEFHHRPQKQPSEPATAMFLRKAKLVQPSSPRMSGEKSLHRSKRDGEKLGTWPSSCMNLEYWLGLVKIVLSRSRPPPNKKKGRGP